MNDSSSKKANRYFQSDNRDLQSLFEKVKELELLNNKILPYLDPPIRKYCQVANLMNHRLILMAANGSVATQIRFQTGDLLRKFRQDPMLKHIQDIHCKVRPLQPMPRQLSKPNKKMQPLSGETAEIVREIAESMDDPKLRTIMEKIAKHTSED